VRSRSLKAVVASMSLAALGLLLADCATPYGRESDASSPSSSTGSDGAVGPGAETGAPDSSVAPLGPGQIACASTMTVCDIRQAQCCITLSGTSSMAARTYTLSSALCGPVGQNCGSLVSVGDDFTMKFPQRCASAADCTTGQSCCVLPLDAANRYGKELSSISCLAAADCALKGRAICKGPSDCAATENCLDETDPILNHLYAKFCR
jgi:hypothetical protein